MGLDAWAYVHPPGMFDSSEDEEIAYWRKHADLQRWMEELWDSRHGATSRLGETFNMIPLYLSMEDIDRLEKEHTSLEKGEGFFWGTSSEHDVRETADFIDKAREHLKAGRMVYYYCWW